MQDVQLSGPTCYSKVIQFVASTAARRKVTQDIQHYNILLILTDGVVADMKETISEIVNASSLPLSIVIIGLGDEDFTRMVQLDSDNRKLRSGGRQAVRDILQFVPFRAMGGDMGKLAREVLGEIPQQLTEFMKSQNIRPGEPLDHSDVSSVSTRME